MNEILIVGVVCGGLGFVVGWFGAWMFGAYNCVKTCIFYRGKP